MLDISSLSSNFTNQGMAQILQVQNPSKPNKKVQKIDGCLDSRIKGRNQRGKNNEVCKQKDDCLNCKENDK